MSASWQALRAISLILMLPGSSSAVADQPGTFVGVQTCAGCHTVQFDVWRGSHHALAMQPALEATVFADFAVLSSRISG